jgi:hypothetical protein
MRSIAQQHPQSNYTFNIHKTNHIAANIRDSKELKPIKFRDIAILL